jgi:hypothetical protein
LFSLNLQIEYKLKKKNLVNDFSRRLDYVNAKSISLCRDEITLSSLKIIKKNREIRVRSWTIIEKKNLKFFSSYNHDSQDETREIFLSIVARMNVVSNVARVSIFEIQTMMRRFKKRKDKKIVFSKTDEITIDFKSMRFRFIEFNRNVKCQRVIDATEKEIVFISFSFELRIVLRILQKTNHLAMRRRSRVASSSSWNLKQEMKMIANELESDDELSSNDKKNSLWHVKNDILCRKNKWYISLDLLRTELLKRNHDNFNARHFDVLKTIELIKRKYY